MTRLTLTSCALVVSLSMTSSAQILTEPRGEGAPFDLGQPALGVTQALAITGSTPSPAGADSAAIGIVHTFAGGYGPNGAPTCEGQFQPISGNPALFSVLGTRFGGNGTVTYALPDLRGRFMVGAGTGPGLPARDAGSTFGADFMTFTEATMASHQHAMPGGGGSGFIGYGQPFDVHAPSLTLTPMMAVAGSIPATSGDAVLTFIGEIRWFAGNYVPAGWLPCDGRLLNIAQYPMVFPVLGTTFGGDGQTTFALPDLRGRIAVGTGARSGFGVIDLGEKFGSPSLTMTVQQVALHEHLLPTGGGTDVAGGGVGIPLAQPSLGITWLIAMTGPVPNIGGGPGSFDPTAPYLGELVAFAGSFVPSGWARAEGQLLPINQHPVLFSRLGTTYGGDNQTTFALPDLRGRSPVGWSSSSVGLAQVLGAPSRSMTRAELPSHAHLYVPPVVVDAGVPDAGVDAGADAGSDGGVFADAGTNDAGALDDGGVADAGLADGGFVDGGFVDGGVVDGGFVDGGFVDGGFVDGGLVDGGLVDAGVVDAGAGDAGFVDGGSLDAGALDAGGVVDGGATDAGAIPDGGINVPGEPMGCNCSTDGASLQFLVAALVFAARLRRRSRSSH